MPVTRTWSVATSPRNPEKLSGELALLAEFEGQVWDETAQREFTKCLAGLGSFEGEGSVQHSAFTARDRINRAPQTFGFVRFDHGRRVTITPAGRRLIESKRLDELFTRQLLKWQYPSALHSDTVYRASFKIKPFLEVLRMIESLGGLSKQEMALFAVPLIQYSDTASTIETIRRFREELTAEPNQAAKKKFVRDAFRRRFSEIYREDIAAGDVSVREGMAEPGEEGFIKTKIRNAKDYADAAIRYFRFTGLFTLSTHTFRLSIKEEKLGIVRAILLSQNPEPRPFEDKTHFWDYLGDLQTPAIPQDDAAAVRGEVETLLAKGRERGLWQESTALPPGLEELKDLRDGLTVRLEDEILRQEQTRLRGKESLADILQIFEKIEDRYNDEIPDKPLFMEWNVWRAFSFLNDGEVRGNLKMDTSGAPISKAPGGMADIVCHYRDFVLAVEVTLATGQRQYETEGEPVPRHVGHIQRELRGKGDMRPVFGFFIASSLNPSSAAHFFMLSRTEVEYYGGKARIVPVDLAGFVRFLKAASTAPVTSRKLQAFLEGVSAAAESARSETEWLLRLNAALGGWVSS